MYVYDCIYSGIYRLCIFFREYKKYGDISVRVVLEPDERVAYVYFRNFDDARDARHSKSRIILFDKPALVEPVYESRCVKLCLLLASAGKASYQKTTVIFGV